MRESEGFRKDHSFKREVDGESKGVFQMGKSEFI